MLLLCKWGKALMDRFNAQRHTAGTGTQVFLTPEPMALTVHRVEFGRHIFMQR